MYLEILRDAYQKDGSIHHAYLIQGDKESALEALFSFFETDMKITTKGNPDVQYLEFDSFTISDGRALQDRAAQRALHDTKLFVATFNRMTLEAQNALLKLFEDPTENTHFFFITDHIDSLLHTLRSRMMVLEKSRIITKDMSRRALDLLTKSAAERLKNISDIVESKDKALAHALLDALEAHLHTTLHTKRNTRGVSDGLNAIAEAKKYLPNRGSSVKLLLEHVALTLPNSK